MFLYIIHNEERDKYYIGITNNLERRKTEHNSKKKQYTGKFKSEWKLVYSKKYKTKKEAMNEESRLKKAKNKNYIRWYISNR